MGEETSDDSGLGKNRDPVDLGRAESRDGVVGFVEEGGPDTVPLEADASMDSSAGGPSDECCDAESFVDGLGEAVPFNRVAEAESD